MNSKRIEYLSSLLSSQTDDPFIRYGLALELLHHDPDQAIAHFEILLEEFPDYLPTYYQAANLLLEIGSLERAVDIANAGMAIAEKQGENKTRDELNALLTQIQ